MDQAITIDVIGKTSVTITQGDSFVSTEISPGNIYIMADDTEIKSKTFPMVISPAKHMGLPEIWDSEDRLVYLWRSLTRMLASTAYGSSKSTPVISRARNTSQPMRRNEPQETLTSSPRCGYCHSGQPASTCCNQRSSENPIIPYVHTPDRQCGQWS